ncbi:MAG: hypothetical protein A3K77_07480 [Euryarchaeota archaeon RBG_13_31_8]|nr:MAG: hypothetical protein A3K77_07480 [Euryarchaeota archaeon RBG_13_31_8]
MEKISELMEKIKTLKQAREILQNEYRQSEFHKKKEASSQDLVPPSPGDKEIYKLLVAIQQLDFYIKKLQDEQFEELKKEK